MNGRQLSHQAMYGVIEKCSPSLDPIYHNSYRSPRYGWCNREKLSLPRSHISQVARGTGSGSRLQAREVTVVAKDLECDPQTWNPPSLFHLVCLPSSDLAYTSAWQFGVQTLDLDRNPIVKDSHSPTRFTDCDPQTWNPPGSIQSTFLQSSVLTYSSA